MLLLGWDLATLVAVYWAENGVAGIYAVGRIVAAANRGPFALHMTIIVGAFAVALLGQPIGALVVMVVLKTGADLAAHLGERARAAGQARQAGIASGA